jgi:undecaprenyl-diphosphatase
VTGIAWATLLPAAIGPFADAAEWAASYGYLAVLLIVAGDGVIPIFPGETSIVVAAVLAADGRLSLFGVILAGAVGAVIGDSLAYWGGRAGGPQIRRGLVRMAGRERIEAGERMVARQGAALVFTGRFLPGLRLAINLACGAGAMPFGRFLFFDTLGAIVWSTQAALIGYFAGRAFAEQTWLALVIALGVAGIVMGIVYLRERRRIREERRLAGLEDAPGEA